MLLNFVARFIKPLALFTGLFSGAWAIASKVFFGVNMLSWVGPALNFLRTPLGQVVAAVAIAVVVFLAGDIHGARKESAYYQKREAAAATEAAQKLEAEKQLAAQLAAKQAAELQTENDQLNQKVAEYEKTLAANSSCRLGAGDVKRLRQLAK